MKKHFKKFLLLIYKLYSVITKLEDKNEDIEHAACWRAFNSSYKQHDENNWKTEF